MGNKVAQSLGNLQAHIEIICEQQLADRSFNLLALKCRKRCLCHRTYSYFVTVEVAVGTLFSPREVPVLPEPDSVAAGLLSLAGLALPSSPPFAPPSPLAAWPVSFFLATF